MGHSSICTSGYFVRNLLGGHFVHSIWSFNDALSEFSMTDSVKVRLSHKLVLDGAGTAKDVAAVVLADHD
jgi:hypothetical protein